MPLSCENMEVGQTYVCESCGLELQVVKTCDTCSTEESECGCKDEEPCTFRCCGKDLTLKTE
ncbi:MAG TPA: hypothetical protein VKK79_18705 [Candidatus Lokiarchaeia archaeon]|nr:hypothetical protein [Candidatus Lokiarchaeia archaeon]